MSSVDDALQAIYDENGYLDPRLVVEAARAEDHPLHRMVFDVPVEQAAERYYLDRAHGLIRTVKISHRRESTQEKIEVRKWHATAGPAGIVYEPLDRIKEDPFLRKLVLANAEREWRDLYVKFGHLQEWLEVIREDLVAAK